MLSAWLACCKEEFEKALCESATVRRGRMQEVDKIVPGYRK